MKEGVTSIGSLIADLGKGVSGSEIWSDKAVADLSLNSLHVADSENMIHLADGEKIVLGLEDAEATAGIIEFIFEIIQLG